MPAHAQAAAAPTCLLRADGAIPTPRLHQRADGGTRPSAGTCVRRGRTAVPSHTLWRARATRWRKLQGNTASWMRPRGALPSGAATSPPAPLRDPSFDDVGKRETIHEHMRANKPWKNALWGICDCSKTNPRKVRKTVPRMPLFSPVSAVFGFLVSSSFFWPDSRAIWSKLGRFRAILSFFGVIVPLFRVTKDKTQRE